MSAEDRTILPFPNGRRPPLTGLWACELAELPPNVERIHHSAPATARSGVSLTPEGELWRALVLALDERTASGRARSGPLRGRIVEQLLSGARDGRPACHSAINLAGDLLYRDMP